MPAGQSDQSDAYTGIPRERIPWFPTIDVARCQSEACQQECIAACPQGVYRREADGRVIVARPMSCTVGDISCSFQCPLDAIRFPSQRDLRRMLRQLRQELGAS